MEDIKTETLTGTVVFLEANQGSKSEGVFPYLYVSRDEKIKLLLKGDNPFENTALHPYDGKPVEIVGMRKRNGTFVIERVSVKEVLAATTENAALDEEHNTEGEEHNTEGTDR